MLRSLGASAAEQLAARLESLDPAHQGAQARATWDLLERAVNAFKEQLLALPPEPHVPRAGADPAGRPEFSVTDTTS
jgi:hypothetical protein